MGQCGCGDFAGEFTLPAPDGLYVFWRYAPCDGCGTPAGLVVCHLRTEEDIELWSAGRLPKLTLQTERLIPVLMPDALAQVEAKTSIADLDDGGDGYATLGAYLEDEGHRIIGEAMEAGAPGWEDWEK